MLNAGHRCGAGQCRSVGAAGHRGRLASVRPAASGARGQGSAEPKLPTYPSAGASSYASAGSVDLVLPQRAAPAPGSRLQLGPRYQPAGPSSFASIDQEPPSGTYGFGFSAGGLLFPYFLGIMLQWQAMDVLRAETPVAGASAGSIVAVCAKSGLGEAQLLDAFMDLARDCRAGGTRARLKHVLRRVLHEALPDDIHHRCEGRCFLAVTQLMPAFEPQTVSSFRSRQDVIETLLTSSHIPWWFDGSVFTLYRDGVFFDGGLTNFIPSTPGVDRCYKISCFPSQQIRFPGVSLSPDTFEPCPHDMRTMLAWAFEPAPEEQLLQLIEKGRRDARSWALANVPATQLVLA